MFFSFYREKTSKKHVDTCFFDMFFHVFSSSSGTWWTSPWGHRDRPKSFAWLPQLGIKLNGPSAAAWISIFFSTYRNSQKVGKETSCSRNSLTRTRGVHLVLNIKCETSTSSKPCLAPSDPRWPLLVINPWGFGGLWNCQLVKYREINSKLELKHYRHRLFSSEIIGEMSS